MIKLLKRNTKWMLKVIISIQLCLSPYYAYSNDNDTPSDAPKNVNNSNNPPIDPNTLPESLEASIREAFSQFSEGTIDPFQMALDEQERDLRAEDEKSPELQVGKKIDILNAIATAMDTGTLDKYLDEYPEVRKKSENIFLFADQRVETISYQPDSQQNTLITETTKPVNLNDYENHPIPVFFKDIKVKYDQESKELIFEGIRKEMIGGQERELVVVRHYVANMNIINYVNDGELLVLVDKNKGLLVVNMIFAKAYLSKSPIPFTTVPVPVLRHLEEKISLDSNRGKVTVEFYSDKAHVPDTVPEYIDNLQKTIEGRTFITHGDLMVSYTDSNNQKHLVQFLKRTELAGWLKLDYTVLDLMIKKVAPYIMSAEEITLFEKKYSELDSSDKSRYSLAALFSRGSIQKLIQAKDSIAYIRDNQLENLIDEKNVTHRQIDILEEIRENVDLAVENIAEQIEGQQPTQEEIERSSAEEQNNKKVEPTSKALRLIKAIHNKSSKPIGSFVKEQKVELTVMALIFTPGLYFYFFVKDLLYMDGLSFYSATTLPHLLAVGAILPIFLILAAKASIPIAKGVHKKLPTNFTGSFINQWGDTKWPRRLTGFAVRFVSIGMLGAWIWSARAVGKPHFFKAIHKKLNPIQKISVNSDIGQVVDLKKDTYLGISGWQWRKKSEEFTENEHLLNVVEEKKMRIHFTAWLMATLAVSQKEGISAIDSLIYGVGRFDLKELANIQKDHALQMEVLWVMKNLKKEIEKMDTMDMRTEMTNLDPALLNKYYENAQQHVQRFRSDPHMKKKMRAMTYASARLINQTPLRNLHWRNLLTHNMEESEKLAGLPNNIVTDRFITEFMVDHIAVMIVPLMVTERATFNVENFTVDLSMYTNKFLFTGESHLQDVWQNILTHFIIAGGQRAMQLSDNPLPVKNIAAEYADTYKSSANTLYPIKEGKKHTIFEELITIFSYMAMTGNPDKTMDYPKNFTNVGETLWKEWKTRFKTWQIGATLLISMRLWLSPQTFEEAAFAYLLINLLGGTINAFWMILARSQQMSEAKLNSNKKRMGKLRDKLYRVNQALYESEGVLQTDYKEAVLEMLDLYKNKDQKEQLLRVIESINPTLFTYIKDQQEKSSSEFSGVQNLEAIKATSEQFLNLISKSPPLPTEPPEIARKVLSFVFGGIVTTFIAIKLIVFTFDKNNLNWETVGITAGIMFSLYTALYWGYSEKFKQWRNTKSLLSRKTQRARDWSIRFYKEVLDVGQGTINLCRKAFRGSS